MDTRKKLKSRGTKDRDDHISQCFHCTFPVFRLDLHIHTFPISAKSQTLFTPLNNDQIEKKVQTKLTKCKCT